MANFYVMLSNILRKNKRTSTSVIGHRIGEFSLSLLFYPLVRGDHIGRISQSGALESSTRERQGVTARPQPRLDRDLDGGMATVVGRVRPEEALGSGIKFVCLSHNTKKGAAKGELLAAEYLHRQGLLP